MFSPASSKCPETPLIYGSDTLDSINSSKSEDAVLKCSAEEAEKTQYYIQNGIRILTSLWEEVHMSEEARLARVQQYHVHVRNIVDEMLDDERKMVNTVKKGIGEKETEIKRMRLEMEMDPWSSQYPYPSIALLREAEKQLHSLTEKYDVLMAEQQKILEKMDLLCYRLGKNMLNYVPDSRKLLSHPALENLQNTVSDFEEELTNRLVKAVREQRDLQKWCRVLGKIYGDHDEPDLKIFLEENMASDDFQLTLPIMDRLQQFWQEVSGMYNSWVEEMDMEWTSNLEELKSLWEKCHISEERRRFSSIFDPTRHTQQDVDDMVHETIRLTAIYAARQPIYQLLEQWKEAWKQKVNMEQRKKAADYYQSRERGHNLMRDAQKERHLNEIRLPELKRNLTKAYVAYKKAQPDDTIVIDGYEPLELVKWMEAEYGLDKEREKSAKVAQKEQQRTPFARGDSLRTPVKVKSGVRTPVSPSRISQKKPKMSAELEISAISPVRYQMEGPRTSSPKKIAENNNWSLTPKRPLRRGPPRRIE